MATDQTIEPLPVLRLPLFGRCGDRRVVAGWSLIADDAFGHDLLFGAPWHFNGRYVMKAERLSRTKHQTVYLHAAIFHHYHGTMPAGKQVDHEDRNRLNNHPSNLRSLTPSHNVANSGRFRNNTSGYRGVSWMKKANKWIAHVRLNGTLVHLGCYRNILDAAKVVNSFFKEHFPHVPSPNQIPTES